MCPSVLRAQINVQVQKKDFRIEGSDFDAAWKNVKDGDNYFAGKGVWYGRAYDEYRKAMTYNNSNPELNYKIGAAALFSDRKEEAALYLLKAYELKGDVADDILLLTGRALQYSGIYTEAVGKLEEYLAATDKKPRVNVAKAKKYVEECSSAMVVTKDTVMVSFNNPGSNINSNTDDYSAIFSADGQTMFFTSRREMFKRSNNLYSDSKFDENIFISGKNNGVWEPAMTGGKNLTTTLCEAPVFLSADGNKLYIYAGYENGGDIKVSEKRKGVWRTPRNVPYGINTGGSETSFTISPSGDEILFVSDGRKNGLGGKDIFSIKKINDRKWSKPENVGAAINTPFDEEGVRFSQSADTLWFSSQGHNTIGGYDIFYSVKDQTGLWGRAVNAGYPLNTQWDELFYYPCPIDTGAFWLASNRPGGSGGLDIYRAHYLPPVPVMDQLPPPIPDTVIIRDTVIIVKEVPAFAEPEVVQPPDDMGIYLAGRIVDSETGEPVLAKVDIIDIPTNKVVATTASSDVDGSYRVRLPARQSWLVDLRSPGFLSDMKRINIPEKYDQDSYSFNSTLIRVKVGKKVVLNNILFETGKSILTKSSYEELDRLVQILEENAHMRIEISGHTDNTGSLALNLRLSEDRSKAVVEYLIKKGIVSSRLEFKGFGPDQPIAENTTAAGRSKNRRVEFKILEF